MASATPRGEGFLTLLRKRNFLLLWLAQLISMTAFWAANYGLIILIKEKTSSTTLVGLAIICASLPAVLIGAPAGVFVDRRNKRRVLFYSNCLRIVATLGFVLSLIINSSQLVVVYLLTLLISGIGQFFAPAEGASIPMLVSDEELMPALSLFQITSMLSNALGFLILAPVLLIFLPKLYIGGLLFDRIESLYVIMAVLYAVCAVLIALIPPQSFIEPKPRKTTTADLTGESLGVLQTVWHLRACWRRPGTRLAFHAEDLQSAGPVAHHPERLYFVGRAGRAHSALHPAGAGPGAAGVTGWCCACNCGGGNHVSRWDRAGFHQYSGQYRHAGEDARLDQGPHPRPPTRNI